MKGKLKHTIVQWINFHVLVCVLKGHIWRFFLYIIRLYFASLVFLDIMLLFGRRGRENLATLTRDDFAVTKNGNGTLYVYKATDEKTKNHQDDNQKASDGRMYEIKDSNRCPVRSFVKLVKRLNPKHDRLF